MQNYKTERFFSKNKPGGEGGCKYKDWTLVALLYSHTLQSVKIEREKLKVSFSDLAGNCY